MPMPAVRLVEYVVAVLYMFNRVFGKEKRWSLSCCNERSAELIFTGKAYVRS